jgi:hypothetical protein
MPHSKYVLPVKILVSSERPTLLSRGVCERQLLLRIRERPGFKYRLKERLSYQKFVPVLSPSSPMSRPYLLLNLGHHDFQPHLSHYSIIRRYLM